MALGPVFHKVFMIIIALVQFQFTISQLAFIVESAASTIGSYMEDQAEIVKNEHTAAGVRLRVTIAVVIVIIFAPMTWVKELQRFRFGMMFGVGMIFITVVTISGFCFHDISERDWAPPKSTVVAVETTYFDMIGFSFFMFEGIGCVMPVMNACKPEVHEKFPQVLAAALFTLCSTYILFSELCYFTFGRDLDESIVMEEMPADNPIIKLVKVLFCINILFSYPITIFPTNQILDGFLFSRIDEKSTLRRILFCAMSTFIVIFGLINAIAFYHDLDKLLATTGVLFGTFVVLFVPSLCHYKLLASNVVHGTPS